MPLRTSTTVVAFIFETIALATPLQLLGVLDFGGGGNRQQLVGALLALLMGAGFAAMLTLLADGVGQQLKRQRYRHLLDGEDTSAAEAEGWPRPAAAVLDDRVVGVAVGALALALFAAAVIRQAAISILTDVGLSQVSIGWPIFLLLTAAVFTGVATVAYCTARPLADENERLGVPVGNLDKKIAATHEECFRLAAKIEICRARTETIVACSIEEQLGQLQLVAAQIARRRGANPHIYGALAEPQYVRDILANPGRPHPEGAGSNAHRGPPRGSKASAIAARRRRQQMRQREHDTSEHHHQRKHEIAHR